MKKSTKRTVKKAKSIARNTVNKLGYVRDPLLGIVGVAGIVTGQAITDIGNEVTRGGATCLAMCKNESVNKRGKAIMKRLPSPLAGIRAAFGK